MEPTRIGQFDNDLFNRLVEFSERTPPPIMIHENDIPDMKAANIAFVDNYIECIEKIIGYEKKKNPEIVVTDNRNWWRLKNHMHKELNKLTATKIDTSKITGRTKESHTLNSL